MTFPITIDNTFLNIDKINPIQQEAVWKMVKLCSEDPNIKKAVVFGSSVRDDCRPDSDIDIYFEFVGEKTDWPVVGEMTAWDKWDNFTIDRRMEFEIGRTGIVVYERQ